MRKHALYEVWFSRGAGLVRGPGFARREDARHYCEAHAAEAVYAVKTPEGRWETWGKRRDAVR